MCDRGARFEVARLKSGTPIANRAPDAINRTLKTSKRASSNRTPLSQIERVEGPICDRGHRFEVGRAQFAIGVLDLRSREVSKVSSDKFVIGVLDFRPG